MATSSIAFGKQAAAAGSIISGHQGAAADSSSWGEDAAAASSSALREEGTAAGAEAAAASIWALECASAGAGAAKCSSKGTVDGTIVRAVGHVAWAGYAKQLMIDIFRHGDESVQGVFGLRVPVHVGGAAAVAWEHGGLCCVLISSG